MDLSGPQAYCNNTRRALSKPSSGDRQGDKEFFRWTVRYEAAGTGEILLKNRYDFGTIEGLVLFAAPLGRLWRLKIVCQR